MVDTPARLWVVVAALESVREEAERAWPFETGGVLLGYEPDGSDDVVVTAVTGPGPTALHARSAFVPDDLYHARAIAAVYESSGRRATYLGDWHSHPGGAAAPSRKDRRTLRAMARFRAGRTPNPVMLLAAGSPDAGWGIRAWRRFRAPHVPLRACVVELVVRSYVDSPA